MAASLTYNNPLAQWPNTWTSYFGASGAPTIGGGNLIANFSDPLAGASANVATMLSPSYANLSISQMISKWSGGNSSDAYLNYVVQNSGVDPNANVTDVLNSDQGPAMLSAMANWEAGNSSGSGMPLSTSDWSTAINNAQAALGLGGSSSTGGMILGDSGYTGGAPSLSGALGDGGGLFGGSVIPTTGAGVLPSMPNLPSWLGGGNLPGGGLGAPASKGSATAGAPGWLGSLTQWVAGQVTRGTVILLGLIVVAIGLALLGRRQIVAVAGTVAKVQSYRQSRATTTAARTFTERANKPRKLASEDTGTPGFKIKGRAKRQLRARRKPIPLHAIT